MGMDATAFLFYGVVPTEDSGNESALWHPYQEDDDGNTIEPQDDCWEDRYVRLLYGLSYDGPSNYPGYDKVAHIAFLDAKRDKLAASPSPCEIDAGGSRFDSSGSQHFVYLKASMTRVDWDRVEPIDLPVENAEWENVVRDWCRLMGVSIEGRRIGWFMAAAMG